MFRHGVAIVGGKGRLFMRLTCKILASVLRDESGGEVLEFVLVAGLIVLAAISIIGKVGSKVVARWTSLNSSL